MSRCIYYNKVVPLNGYEVWVYECIGFEVVFHCKKMEYMDKVINIYEE
ncbi:MAG: hypothetical protein K0S75_1458 [Clostridia bacterium]|jgi:hypothetical protein|nr:hypothetical protein [Clostridia bacterium]